MESNSGRRFWCIGDVCPDDCENFQRLLRHVLVVKNNRISRLIMIDWQHFVVSLFLIWSVSVHLGKLSLFKIRDASGKM